MSHLQNVIFASPTELVGCARPEQALAQNIASKQVAESSQRQRKVGRRRAAGFWNYFLRQNSSKYRYKKTLPIYY